MYFGDVQNLDKILQLLPWAIGATVIFIILFVFAKIYRPFVAKKVAGQTFTGMTVQDIDRMRREGVISEEEYRRIRHKAAERELESMKHQTDVDRDRKILAEAAMDPNAALKLLTPEQLAEAQRRVRPTGAKTKPTAPQAEPQSETKRQMTDGDWGDPLAGVGEPRKAAPAPGEAGVTHPHPGKIKIPPPQVPPEGTTTNKQPTGELEILLQKGAISREEYERLKGLIK